MSNRWVGPAITGLTLLGVLVILALNLDLGTPRRTPTPVVYPLKNPYAPLSAARPGKPAGFREYPIGDPAERHGLRVTAVWLPAVAMDGAPSGGTDVIHLEADVKATEGNPNGFALGEFVPYLKIAYTITPVGQDGPAQKGELRPMVASDGLHYGASLAMPKAGAFRLTYALQPPSAGGLGRHSDPVTGVSPWWEPFEAQFDWDYPGPQAP